MNLSVLTSMTVIASVRSMITPEGSRHLTISYPASCSSMVRGRRTRADPLLDARSSTGRQRLLDGRVGKCAPR